MDIEDSTDVTLQGLTINGGDVGVFCGDLSVCRFKNNTIQNATAAPDGVGVWVGRSRATFNGDVVQHNSGQGVNVANGSTAYGSNIQVNNNGGPGINIVGGSLFMGDPASIQNNGTFGVRVVNHSTFSLFAGAITANAGSGVTVRGASEANIQSVEGPINISGNGGNGVQIHDLSFAVFLNGAPPPLTVTGNAAPDVNCFQLSYSAQNATTDIGGGTTNCTEPL